MTVTINKIKLFNYKRFKKCVIEPNQKINILIGDNETGKSSILEAIDLVASGNVRKVEALGIENLMNTEAVQQFKKGDRLYDNLPTLTIELYLSGPDFDFTMNGKNNTDGTVCDGIRLVCKPNPDFRTEITEALSIQEEYFPYDYYSIRFSTFADEGYSGYKKKLRCALIDSSSMGTEYATNDFIRRMYNQYTIEDTKERVAHQSRYRQMKNSFRTENLDNLNSRLPHGKNYYFGLRNCSTTSFENDLMIFENDIGIDNKGTGKQVFIKTDFALERAGTNVDVVLIEEPENHLSHVNLRKLIQRIAETQCGQIFITTHNSLISARLELNNVIIMSEGNMDSPITLKDLNKETSKFFMKAPYASIIEFALSKKTILVEGPAEFILFDKFYQNVAKCKPEADGVQIIEVHGLSFKRYLDIAKISGRKVAVVTDNDGDYQNNCVERYKTYSAEQGVKIFYDTDNSKKTFEVVLYKDNESLCDCLYGDHAQRYMLNNKTEAAYKLLCHEKTMVVPAYIKEAIKWIRE